MAIKMKTVVTYRAKATCPSHSRTDIPVRDLVAVIDEPIERGGTNLGPSPTETALTCLLYTSPSPRDRTRSRMPSSA